MKGDERSSSDDPAQKSTKDNGQNNYSHTTKLLFHMSTFYVGVKRKHELTGVAKDLASALVELEKSAESRYEERGKAIASVS